MSPQELIAEARRLAVPLTAHDHRLRSTPAGALPPNLRAAVREHAAADIKAHLDTTGRFDSAPSSHRREPPGDVKKEPDPPPSKSSMLPLPVKPSAFDWTQHDVETLLPTEQARCAYWRERTSTAIRPRIEKLVMEFEPVIAGLLDKGDFDAVRYALIDVPRQIGDALSGRGWD